jgi:malate synthase
VTLKNGAPVGLKNPAQFVGFQGEMDAPSSVLLSHHGLHMDIRIDRAHPIGKTDPAGVKPTWCSSRRCPPSSTWRTRWPWSTPPTRCWPTQLAGHPEGHADREVSKGGKTFTRGLNPDRQYTGPRGEDVALHGRSLLFVRNVGHLMTNPAILWGDEGGARSPKASSTPWSPPPSRCTTCSATASTASATAAAGSVYIVKPKMHGPAEVAFACELFGRVEQVLGLPDSTVKLGIMDEERRTSVNLKACIAAAAERVAFINTGFLDRTGDEMHTAMQAGPMMRKGDMKSSAWIQAYERSNVLVGLEPAACAARRRSARACGPCPT